MLNKGAFAESSLCKKCLDDIQKAINGVCWPLGNNKFCIRGEKNANGVKPISSQFAQNIELRGWTLEDRITESKILPLTSGRTVSKTGIDATFPTNEKFFAVEWETGNISSSHRSMNKLCYGIYTGVLSAAVIILPTRDLYTYLPDRVGNYPELVRYFPFWEAFLQHCEEGFFHIIQVEHDELSNVVPYIPKGSDGNAPKGKIGA